jgi:Ca2+-binding EF-hand superfamily protein
LAVSETNFLDKYSELRSLGLPELLEIWNHYDRDGSGFLEVGPELDRFLTDMIKAGGEQVTELKVSEFIAGVLELFDLDADGKLNFAEVEELLNG